MIFKRYSRVVVYDGSRWRDYPTVRSVNGLAYRVNGAEVVLTDELISYAVGRTAIVCVDQIALADHVALETARKHIALSAIFRIGGDLMRYLQMAAAVLPVLVSLYVAWTVSGMVDYQASVQALVTMLENSPLIKRGQ